MLPSHPFTPSCRNSRSQSPASQLRSQAQGEGGNRDAGLKLRGDRNQCQGCHCYFNSTRAFDKHRTGQHGKDRRCLTAQEMSALGMVLGSDGFWRGSAMPRDVLERVTA